MVPIQPSSEITTGPGIIYSFIHSSQGACLWADHHALHLFAIHIHLAKSLLRNPIIRLLICYWPGNSGAIASIAGLDKSFCVWLIWKCALQEL